LSLACLLLLCCGCLQNLHETSVSDDSNYELSNDNETSPPLSDVKAPQYQKPDNTPSPSNLDSGIEQEIPCESNRNSIKRYKTEEDDNISGKTVQSLLDDALDFCQLSQDFWQKGELENAIEALDQAYFLILKADTYEIPKLIQQKEDLRFMISKRILEIYASRNIVVNGNHNEIPIRINKHVQREIDLFTKGREKRFFIESYKRSGMYREKIVSALEEAGLPVELSWLPLIESGFKVKALSRARALGLWQFIPSTGYKFGLKRDLYIDERLDPVKSTEAAIAYLKELHQIFGDWTTVLAAYNCGEGKVLRVIRNQNINYLDNFWDLYERLPFETARYVPRFLATIHIIQNLERYGLDQIQTDLATDYETVTVNRQVQLKHIAKEIGVTEQLMKELNPELRYHVLPPTNYALKIPPGKAAELVAQIDSVPLSSPPRPSFVYHRVKPGETLSTIAQRYRTSVRSIALANGIRNKSFIVAGKKLKIPQKGTTIYSIPTTSKVKRHRPSTHVVKSGDSLWKIAKQYDTTAKDIQEQNRLEGADLHIGQVLKIPGGEIMPFPGNLKLYRVKNGDSPYTIAQFHNIPLNRFLRINNLTSQSKIYPGQTLYIE
jgi:membrane-bound lytic murein transglycosylase D